MPTSDLSPRTLLWTALALGALLACGACGGSTSSTGSDGGSSSSSGGSGGSSGGSSGGGSGGSSGGGSSGGSSGGGSSSGSSSGSSGGSSSSGSSSGGTGEVPVNHRPNNDQCTAAAPAGNCMIMGTGGVCSTDAQCADAGPNARCDMSTGGGAQLCFCAADMCTDDGACPTGQTCACHGSAYLDQGNTCVPGNCRVDSDCGAGGYCSPSRGSNNCGGLVGYYCHTPNDRCENDSDCADAGPTMACNWSPNLGYWQCSELQLCP